MQILIIDNNNFELISSLDFDQKIISHTLVKNPKFVLIALSDSINVYKIIS
jgi:hypothetical protein